MFVKKVQKPNGATAVLIVESVRKAGKITHKTLRSLGSHYEPKELELVIKTAEAIVIEMKERAQPVLTGLDPLEFYARQDKMPKAKTEPEENFEINPLKLEEETRLIVGTQEVFGQMYNQFKFNEVLDTTYKADDWNAILRQSVLSRITDPASKLKTSERLVDYQGIDIPVQKFYRMMDKVAENQDRIRDFVLDSTKKSLDNQIDVAFFDVTTLHFESFDEDELRRFVFSKNCRFKETQVVLALQTTREGLPLGYDLYPGNTYEGKTLIEAVQRQKEKFNVGNVVLVADRAMFNRSNLALMDQMGVSFVVAAKLKALPKFDKASLLEFAQSLDKKKSAFKEFELEGRRLITHFCPDRAKKDLSDRERLVTRLRKQLGENKEIQIAKLIKNQGTKKYLKYAGPNKTRASVNEDKILEDAKWDGLHGIITNVQGERAESLLHRYKDLWQIEEAFRINKHDLKMRPIFHYKPERIKAHIAICYMAYAMIANIRFRLKKSELKLSVEKIRDQLGRVQKSVVVDPATKKRFVLPSKLNPTQEKIYQSLGVQSQTKPYFI